MVKVDLENVKDLMTVMMIHRRLCRQGPIMDGQPEVGRQPEVTQNPVLRINTSQKNKQCWMRTHRMRPIPIENYHNIFT